MNAIRTNPDDDTPRLVYADWLQEHEQPDRAEFIRIQVQLAGLDQTDPRRASLEDRENELLRTHEAEWLGAMPSAITGWKFERGFVAELAGPTSAFVGTDTGGVFEQHPVSRLRLASPSTRTPSPVGKLLNARWLPGVRELLIDHPHISGNGLGRLLRAKRLAGLTRLELTGLHHNGQDSQLPAILAESVPFQTVKRFRLSRWNNSGEALLKVFGNSAIEDLVLQSGSRDHLKQLLTSGFVGQLNRLELMGIDREGWPSLHLKRAKPAITHLGLTDMNEADLDPRPIVSAPACANLISLDVNEARIRADAVEKLAQTDFWLRCTELKMIRGKCPPELMELLAKKPGPECLRVLKLGETGLRDAGVANLCSAPWAASLVELDLMRNFLTDDACRAIRDSGPFHNLRHLDLRTNGPKLERGTTAQITNKGLAALAEAPCLRNLRHLNLHSLPMTAAGVDAIINNPNWRLRELDIGGTEIGAAGIKALAKSPNISRLTRLNLSFITNLKPNDLLPLAQSPYLSPLCEVSALYYKLTDRVRATFAERLGRRFRV